MDAEKFASVCPAKEVLENTIVHEVVTTVPPVRWVVVDGFNVEPQSLKESDEPIGPLVGP